MTRRHIIPIFIPHLGCPFSCVFCDQKSIAGAQRAPRPEEVEEIVLRALDECGGAPEVAFYGGSFTAIPQPVQDAYLTVTSRFLKDNKISGVRVSTRPDFIDKATVKWLGSHGVNTIELGAQSMFDEVLEASGRGHTAQDVYHASEIIRAGGCELILQMMVGLPGDSRQRALESGRRIAACSPHGVRIYPTVVVSGTELARRYAEGSYTPLALDEAVETCAELLLLFARAEIPVLRCGLNPSEDLAGQVIAGAYHPALGELALSRAYLDLARSALSGWECQQEGKLVLQVHPRRVSALAGQHGRNKEILIKELSLKEIKIHPCVDLPEWTVRIESWQV